MELFMEPNELRESANAIKNEVNEQLRLYSDTKTLVAQLESGWRGNAQEAYRQSYEAQEAVLRRHTALLSQFADLMRTSADEMERMDSDLTRFFQQF
jgi:WXG100 family type VII secretion target